MTPTIIDMHSHWGTQRGYALQTPEELAAFLDLGHRHPQPAEAVADLHDYAFDVQRAHPDVILGHWLHIDLGLGEAGVAEFERCLRVAPGIVGICVSGPTMGAPPTDPRWTPYYRLSLEAGAETAELEAIDARRPSADDVMRVAFTSGTTGDPKAVIHTYNTTFSTNRLCDPLWGVDGDARYLQFLPVGLNAGLFTIVQVCLEGAAAVLMEHFKPADALESIERERITHFLTAPTGLIALLSDPQLEARDLSSPRLVQTGGSSTPIEVLRDANKRMGVPVVRIARTRPVITPRGSLDHGVESRRARAAPRRR